MKKVYLVIAHCADGDIAINAKGKTYCETKEEAERIKRDFVGFDCPLEILECDYPTSK